MLTSAEVKSEWSYTSALSVSLPGMDRDSFTFFRKIFAVYLEICTKHKHRLWTDFTIEGGLCVVISAL